MALVHSQHVAPSTGMIAFNLDEGKRMWSDTNLKIANVGECYDQVKDVKPHFSGPASLALIVNTLHLAYTLKISDLTYGTPAYDKLVEAWWEGKPLYLNEDDIVDLKRVRTYFRDLHIANAGMSLRELEKTVHMLGFVTETYYAYNDQLQLTSGKRAELKHLVDTHHDKSILNSADDLKELLTKKFGDGSSLYKGFIANFELSDVQYNSENEGHFSPVGGFHVESGSVLVMEVKPTLKAVWVKAEILFEAMRTVDPRTGLPRGLIEIYRPLW